MIFFATSETDKVLQDINQQTQEWTMRCARGEEYWICSDCGCGFPEGMPDKCAYNDQRCTDIIIRDKQSAKVK